MRFLLLTTAVLLPLTIANVAQAQAPNGVTPPSSGPNIIAPPEPVLPQMPRPAEILEGGFAVSGIDDPAVWQFMMGPRGPGANLHLSRSMEGGSIMFRCSRTTGAMDMAVMLGGYTGEVGAKVDVKVSIGNQTSPVPMQVTAAAEGDPSTPLVAQGVVVSDLIAAMASNRSYPEFMTLQAGANKVEFPIGGDRTVHEVSAKICAGWAAAVAQQASPAAPGANKP